MVGFDFDPDRDSMIRLFSRITPFLTSISKKCVIRGNDCKTSMGPAERMRGGLPQTRLSGMTPMVHLFARFHDVRGDCLSGRRRIVHAMAFVLRCLSARNPAAEVERVFCRFRSGVRRRQHQRAFCEPIQLAIDPITTSAAPTQKTGPGVAVRMIVVAMVDRTGVAYDEMDSTRISPRTIAWPHSA